MKFTYLGQRPKIPSLRQSKRAKTLSTDLVNFNIANPALFFLSQEFHTFEFALMKTFAMTLGELDYENDFIIKKSMRHYSEAVNVVFVLFCLAMPIILMNMLVCYFLVYNIVIKLFFAGVRAVSYFSFES